ncbi:unnamed protein product [Allacma fusca]|uniref:Essential protein Yae1 N-terminal domain-containing protein n=1 Tax=Allacma fusca TaxID=39272 RepID=A0A8J2JH18_9HEXA|nr:unnamed protein product [Allacma fusca]
MVVGDEEIIFEFSEFMGLSWKEGVPVRAMATVMSDVRENFREDRALEDIFDSVTNFETRVLEEGFQQGREEGKQETAEKGFIVGFNTGSSIGLELSLAEGFCREILREPPTNRPNNSSLLKLCDEVIAKVKSFPVTNVETEDVLDECAKIKAMLDKVKLMITKKLPMENIVKQKFSI